MYMRCVSRGDTLRMVDQIQPFTDEQIQAAKNAYTQLWEDSNRQDFFSHFILKLIVTVETKLAQSNLLVGVLEEIISQCQTDFIRCETCGDQEDLKGCYIEDTAREALKLILSK
jgi:hypothetical protein